jgi:undecaprenyl-diphosphatase
MDWVAGLDRGLFRTLNSGLAWGPLDVVMPFITDKSHFIALGVVVIAVLVIKGKKSDLRALVFVALTVLVSDFAATQLKDVFARVRPCQALTGVRLLVGCGGSYSFPSGHATNIFAAMVFLSLRYRKYAPFFIAAAVAVAYSRVYVGVHYPLDVLGGAVLGSFFGFLFYEAERKGLGAIKKAVKKI